VTLTGRRLGSQVLDTNAQALIEALRAILKPDMFAWKKDAPSDWTPLSELSAERRMSGQRYPKGIGEGKRVRKWTYLSFTRDRLSACDRGRSAAIGASAAPVTVRVE
jgi:hypothetical protein